MNKNILEAAFLLLEQENVKSVDFDVMEGYGIHVVSHKKGYSIYLSNDDEWFSIGDEELFEECTLLEGSLFVREFGKEDLIEVVT